MEHKEYKNCGCYNCVKNRALDILMKLPIQDDLIHPDNKTKQMTTTTQKYTTWIRDMKLDFISKSEDGKYLDTKVTINDKDLCWITWSDKDNFIKEFTDTINKFAI